MSNNQTVEAIRIKLEQQATRQEGLEDLEALLQSNSTAVLLGKTEEIFKQLRKCLTSDPNNQEVLLKTNAVVVATMSDIQHNEELDIQIAQMIPVFVENLGNHKVSALTPGRSPQVHAQVHSNLR